MKQRIKNNTNKAPKHKMEVKAHANTNNMDHRDERHITWKQFAISAVPLLALIVSAWVSTQKQIEHMKTKVEDMNEAQFHRDMDQKETNAKLFNKLDEIISTQHNIELQLKDKADRK